METTADNLSIDLYLAAQAEHHNGSTGSKTGKQDSDRQVEDLDGKTARRAGKLFLAQHLKPHSQLQGNILCTAAVTYATQGNTTHVRAKYTVRHAQERYPVARPHGH